MFMWTFLWNCLKNKTKLHAYKPQVPKLSCLSCCCICARPIAKTLC